mmetsp:Transcript_29160/g.43940  ORF Transcript_29160/g.43940 Transcript_29160/m.43940 type:complete len:104 (-) Transcript_29160:1614-1925(-)
MFNDQTWDTIFIHEFYDTKFIDVAESAMAWLRAPPQAWATLEICGNFPCTGPLNAWFNFEGTKYYGTKPMKALENFQLLSNNPGFTPYMENCEKQSIMNAYIC